MRKRDRRKDSDYSDYQEHQLPPLDEIPGFEGIQRAFNAAQSQQAAALRLSRQLIEASAPVRPRDRNRFYPESDSRAATGSHFALECNQWRHGMEPELIEGCIKLGRDEVGDFKGMIECSIHAENLTDAVHKLVPVRIRVLSTNAFPTAVKFIDRMKWTLR